MLLNLYGHGWRPRFSVFRFLLPIWVLHRVLERLKSSILKFPRSFHLWSWSFVLYRILDNFSTSLVIIERFTTPSCCQRASFPPELVIKYPNSVSSFQQLRLVLSGDVQLNPDPTALSSSYTMNNSKLSCALLNSLSPCNKIVEFQGLVYGNNLDQLRDETSTIWNKFNAGLRIGRDYSEYERV